MGVQFGKLSFGGKQLEPQELDRVRPILAPYGPDAEGTFCKDNVAMLHLAFHTAKECFEERQPHVAISGALIMWDGRLDNRSELVSELGGGLSSASPDLSIVAAAYERWGTKALAKFIGDWAISICTPRDQSVLLAKDCIGTRHLYYLIEPNQVTWSTILDPLVLAGQTIALNEEYIAGWLSFLPAAHLTPYVGIRAVTPSSWVLIQHAKPPVTTKYWDFDANKRVRHNSDAEYEDHFRDVFAQAVSRRLRSHGPVLAELSGGMDSSAIVCMADTLFAKNLAQTSRLETVSYFNDAEPNWNERPYFTAVEKKRNRRGHHIDVLKQEPLWHFEFDTFAATPFSGGHTSRAARVFAECMATHRSRVLLSGVGGDEVCGGVPTPLPELADLLAMGKFKTFARQLKVWSLNRKEPWIHLLAETVREFLPFCPSGRSQLCWQLPWVDSRFARRNRAALLGYPSRTKLLGPLPTLQTNLCTLDGLRRQLESTALPTSPLYEKRYPFLDRDLLEFMYAVPREQVVRPGERRSLMRRALVGIVPDAVLQRRRKAYVVRTALAALSAEADSLREIAQHMVGSSLGIINAEAFAEALRRPEHGQEAPVVALVRTLGIERWLRNLRNHATAGGGPEDLLGHHTRSGPLVLS